MIEKCKVCMGHGWWPIGDLCPMGPCDAREWGSRVIKCPWCGAGKKKGKRYDDLVNYKLSQELK